jgi:hypothetical protein
VRARPKVRASDKHRNVAFKATPLLRIPVKQRGSYHLSLTRAPLLLIIRYTKKQIVTMRVGSCFAVAYLTSNPLIKRRESYEK